MTAVVVAVLAAAEGTVAKVVLALQIPEAEEAVAVVLEPTRLVMEAVVVAPTTMAALAEWAAAASLSSARPRTEEVPQ